MEGSGIDEKAVSRVPPPSRGKILEGVVGVSKGVSVIPAEASKVAASVTGKAPVTEAADGDGGVEKTTKPSSRAAASGRTQQAAGGKRTAQAGKKQAKPPVRPVIDERKVVAGDYLRKIAKDYYGNEMLWPLIWDYNRELARQSGQKLEDPDLIYPGWTFVIPETQDGKDR